MALSRPFKEDRSSASSFNASLLQTIDGVMSLALCPQVLSQAIQLYCWQTASRKLSRVLFKVGSGRGYLYSCQTASENRSSQEFMLETSAGVHEASVIEHLTLFTAVRHGSKPKYQQ